MISIITHSETGKALAEKILRKEPDAKMIQKPVDYNKLWQTGHALVFIGALGICVR
jgi:cobalamin biosynthesis protein CbiG